MKICFLLKEILIITCLCLKLKTGYYVIGLNTVSGSHFQLFYYALHECISTWKAIMVTSSSSSSSW